DADKEAGQRLARTCRRGDQRVPALRDVGPALLLRRRGTLWKPPDEPRRHRGVEPVGRQLEAGQRRRGVLDHGHGPRGSEGCIGWGEQPLQGGPWAPERAWGPRPLRDPDAPVEPRTHGRADERRAAITRPDRGAPAAVEDRRPPEPCAQVRILPRAPNDSGT